MEEIIPSDAVGGAENEPSETTMSLANLTDQELNELI